MSIVRRIAILSLSLIVTLLAANVRAAEQDAKNAISFGFLGGAGGGSTAFVGTLEYERLVTPNVGVLGRFGYLSYSYDDDYYEEDGTAPGIMGGVKYYFGDKWNGFYLGGNLGIWSTSWDWWEGGFNGSGTSTSMSIGGELGGRFPLGSRRRFALVPNLQFGDYLELSSTGARDSELGFYIAAGLTFSFAF